MKKQVSVYRNLHKDGMFSVRLGGKVIDWASTIILKGNIGFYVGEKGRVRVTKERRKNVHSWVKADEFQIVDSVTLDKNYKELWYSPYFTQYYYDVDNGGVVIGADEVIMANNRVYALNPEYKVA